MSSDERAEHAVVIEKRKLGQVRAICDSCGWRTDWSYDEDGVTAEAELHIIKKRQGSIWTK